MDWLAGTSLGRHYWFRKPLTDKDETFGENCVASVVAIVAAAGYAANKYSTWTRAVVG